MILSDPLPEAAAFLVTAAHRLKDARSYKAAYTAAQRAIAIAPDHVVTQSALAAVLWNMNEWQRAAEILERCVQRAPDNITYWAWLGLCYGSLRRDDEAERAYAKALTPGEVDIKIGADGMALRGARGPTDTERLGVRWNRSQRRLAAGDWAGGFDDFECRVPFRGPPHFPKLPHRTWNGEDLTGKTLLIHYEQGVGDSILSSRYIPLIKQRYPDCRIIWFVHPKLHDLFWEFRHVAEVWPPGHPWPQADYSVFQMSLLRIFGSTPDDVPADPGLIARRASLSAKSVRLPEPHTRSLKIGVAWTGNPEQMDNEERSIPLEVIVELAEDPRCTLFSLQVDPVGAEQLRFAQCGDLIRDCSSDLQVFGFAGTAAMMQNLDLVITTCTSNAHLAGALGVPCWVLLCRNPYWVWGRDSDRSAWYPNTRIFRQPEAGDWRSVIEAVKTALVADAFPKLVESREAA